MTRIDYVSGLNEMYQSQGFPPYRWSEFDSSPWTPFEKPLDQTCLALLSSAGIFRDDQEPFDPWAVNDLSFRQIPADTPFERLKLHHNYFDHRDALKDLNCVFPVHRLKDLEKTGHKRTALQQETVPRIVELLKGQGTDAVLLVAA